MYRIRVAYSELLIKIAFLLLFFFSVFPTSEPFPELNQEVGIEKFTEEGNVLNQSIKIFIFFLALLPSLNKFDAIFQFIKKEKAFSVLLFWSLITLFWSEAQLVGFKRWFQVFLVYFVTIIFLCYFDEKEVLKIMKRIFYPYLVITILSVLLISGAIDSQFQSWRGLTPQKNQLGQIGVISSIITLIIYLEENILLKKIIAIFFFILSIIIVIGTLSSTSYLSLFVFLFVSFYYWILKNYFEKFSAYKFIFNLSLIISMIFFLLAIIYSPNITSYIEGLFGKSEAFYDRGKLWNAILWQASQHLIFGCGFNSFWTIENPNLTILYQSFIWLPNQSHNGYLDILNEIGIVGLVLFFIMIFKNIIRAIKFNSFSPWLWFLASSLLINITESNFLRVSAINNFLILAYFILEKKYLNMNSKTFSI